MDFECSDEVSYPVERLYRLIRDEMPAILPYLDDVEEIRVLEREEQPGGLRLVNLWRGSVKAAPAVVQRFITPDLVTWTDHAFWPTDANRAEWRLEPRVGGKLFECSGTTSVLPGSREGTSRLQVRGALHVHPERLPGVPRLLAGTIRGAVESFIVGMIVPNLKTLARGVQRYHDDQARQS
ncbi:MAG: hypothetical protein M9894_09215 [Planctomycetes bacterium]|nr:hypothetical protein [Planctomycetota bacterium]